MADYMADISSNMQTNTFAKVYLFAKKIGRKANKSKMGGKLRRGPDYVVLLKADLSPQICKIIERYNINTI
mgnify:CR=1 FL=1